jgi:hypothetical protein
MEKRLAFHFDLVSDFKDIPFSKTDSIIQFRRNLHSHIEKTKIQAVSVVETNDQYIPINLKYELDDIH